MNESDTKQAESEKVCGAYLRVPDDYGDNYTTFRCQLALGHTGEHCATSKTSPQQLVRVQWTTDEGPEEF